MRGRDAVALRPVGSPALRYAWYLHLARCLASGPTDGGVLFERATDRPVPWAIVRPEPFARALHGDAGPGAHRLEVADVPAAPPPPVRGALRLGVVLPSGVPADPLAGAGAALGAQDAGAWRAGQTFWVRGRPGELRVAARVAVAAADRAAVEVAFRRAASEVAAAWSRASGGSATVRPAPWATRGDWARGSGRRIPHDAWATLPPAPAASTAELVPVADGRAEFAEDGHAVVFGASGAGKTAFLARRASAAIERGRSTVVLDLHGDLAPRIASALSERGRGRMVAIDLADRPVPGIAALPGGSDGDRAAAHVVAAVKRLSADGAEIHWGFRLERILDAFVRLAAESGGSLRDVYALLTDPARRDAARLATRRSELARFLEELEPIVRRTPDFLWPAAARLAKVVHVPELAELLAPDDGGVPVDALLADGRAIVVRAPFAWIGPEAASFAGSLVLARVYLAIAAGRVHRADGTPVRFVLDEAQAFAPRLLAEMLAESRKFGAELLLATQYPERLAPELRAAAAGTVRHVGSFRVPASSAVDVGRWLGIDPGSALRSLAVLPTGHLLRRDPELGAVEAIDGAGVAPAAGAFAAWRAAVDRTRHEFGTERRAEGPESGDATDELLWQVLAADEEGRPLAPDGATPGERPGPSAPDGGVERIDAIRTAERRGWLVRTPSGLHLTLAGERLLGLHAPTGAARETPEHRALLAAAFRIFARRGSRLEIVRQGRFDTTLPDARLRLLPPTAAVRAPSELAAALDRARDGWAWRYFGGRDVHVEAEVSGALRTDRIRRDLAKARARGAFALFLVADVPRARRIRSVLAREGVDRTAATVWILRVRYDRPRPPAA